MIKKDKITIVGAGPTGLYLAILLAQRGFQIEIFDRLSPTEIAHHSSSRSFSISFFKRGLDALEKVGVLPEITKQAVFLKGTVVHPPYASNVYVDHNFPGNPYIAIKRSVVVDILLKKARTYPSITFQSDMSLVSVDRNSQKLTFKNTKTHIYTENFYNVLLGTDGANSKVRPALFEGQNTEFTQEYEEWKYKQVSLSTVTAKYLKMETDRMHLWPHEKAMLAFFPNLDGSMSGIISMRSFEHVSIQKTIEAYIQSTFPSMKQALPEIVSSMLNNAEGRFVSIHMKPWTYKGSIALFGDAVHAALPSHGQGMTAGFEDVLSFIELLDTHGLNWEQIFPQYEKQRKCHADVLVDASQRSFSKFLRHKKADYDAVYDRVDGLLHKIFPSIWAPPFYTMMSHSALGFADILAIHKKQRTIGKYLGISLAVWIFTKILSYIENSTSSTS